MRVISGERCSELGSGPAASYIFLWPQVAGAKDLCLFPRVLGVLSFWVSLQAYRALAREGLLNVGKIELNYNDKILSFAVPNCKPILKITGSTEWG